ncbi:MAG TPA: MFS transporter [Burkholderiaceae bacterium]|nr:MFS transporter [Burkholderiaceae bacterium]
MSSAHAAPFEAGIHHVQYDGGPAMRRYMITYLLVAVSLIAVAGGIGAVILPLHLQQIEFARFFTGAMAQVNLQDLVALKAQVAAGTVKATLEQLKLLEALAAYESAKASSLSLAASLAVAATMIMQPIIGVTSDRTRSRWGRRAPWMVFGAILALVGVALMYYAASAAQLMLGYALASVACTVVGGPLSATVVDRIPAAKRGAMSAVAGVGLLVGYILGMVAAGVIYAKVGTASYLAFGVLVLLLTLVFITLARDSSSKSLQVEKVSIAGHLNSFTFALRDPDFRWVFLARVIMLFGYSVSGTFGIYMLQSYIEPAMTAEQAAKTMPLLHLVGMPVTLLAMVISGRWSDRVGRRKPFVIGASLLLAASMAVPFIWPTLWALYAQHFLAGIAVGTFLVVDQALLIDVLPDKKAAGRDLGIGTLASNLGQAIGPIVAGLVLSVTGGYRMIWLTALVLTALAALAVVPVKKAK